MRLFLILILLFVIAFVPLVVQAACDGYWRDGMCLPVPAAARIPRPTLTPLPKPLKGVALVDWNHKEDIAALGATWYYGWGEYCPTDDARCLNMVRAWELPKTCYSVLLVGNEPNAVEPYGAPMSPADAARAVRAIEKQCPATKLVAGNVSADNWGGYGGWHGTGGQWLQTFLSAYRSQSGRGYKQALGVHCYFVNYSEGCSDALLSMRRVYAGEMWVTEFGDLSGDPAQLAALWPTLQRFARIAIYTNRQLGGGSDLPGASLVNDDGSLTAAGAVFAGW